MENIAKLLWASDVIKTAKKLVNFITKKPKVLALYRSHKDLEVVKPSSTRYAYMFLMLESLLKIRRTLQQMVTSIEWLD